MQSNVTYIFLTGFPGVRNFKFLVFLVMLVIYCLIISGNALVMVLIYLSKNLHSPMYFFISQVSLFDILLATDVIPNTFPLILKEGGDMSLSSCMAQFFFFTTLEGAECLLLAVMSYDRYLAICNPFHYSRIVNSVFCIRSMFCSCLTSVFMTAMIDISINNVSFCGDNIIDHFFCDLTTHLELACSDISMIWNQIVFICASFLICPLTFIVASYIYIVSTILRIPSITGRKKAFSTCSSHLMVVCMFYGSLMSIYMVPKRGHLGIQNKIMPLFYTMMTPVLNPIIYSFRNKEFKVSFRKITSLNTCWKKS